jgi:hypothetical protein
MKNEHSQERREFVRLDYVTPVAYKVCKEETLRKLLTGYTSNISSAGLLCTIKDKVHPDDILWLSFDRATLIICEELERRSLIYQGGIVGKVVRVDHNPDGSYHVGIQFVTREEENSTHIYPKVHFLKELHLMGDPEEQLDEDELVKEIEPETEEDPDEENRER